MAYEDITMLLGGWEGFELVNVRREPATGDAVPLIELELQPVPNYPKRCSGCGEVVVEVHDVSERRVRDLPILEAETWLVFPARASPVRGAARPSSWCRGSTAINA